MRGQSFPLSDFIVWLIQEQRTRTDAGKEARRLGLNLKDAEWYWRNIRAR